MGTLDPDALAESVLATSTLQATHQETMRMAVYIRWGRTWSSTARPRDEWHWARTRDASRVYRCMVVGPVEGEDHPGHGWSWGSACDAHWIPALGGARRRSASRDVLVVLGVGADGPDHGPRDWEGPVDDA